MADHFTQVRFSNYKGFKRYSVSIGEFNILVGPNNVGKSTVIGAFRLLAEGLKRAKRNHPVYIDSAVHRGYAYRVDLGEVPVSTENVFTDYDDTEAAEISFALSSGNKLRVVFPESDSCLLIPEAGSPVRTRSDFLKEFDVTLSFVPVLGPVEHNEKLYQQEAARRALQSRGASRNFRNIWYHYNENFSEFRDLIRQTWRGVDITAPEVGIVEGEARLHMFCEERRVSREIYWAGFGFQVWCQMLTFIAKSEPASMLVIDEPDIYLHSDLQRQLVHILKDRKGDTLIATHSTEILAQADPGDLVILDRTARSARRVSSAATLKSVFSSLGSSLNPLLTQVGKTRRVVFVEGGDFSVLSSFARKLGYTDVATQRCFAVIKAEGFRPARVKDFSDGMEAMLGTQIARAVVFDRDFRSDIAVRTLQAELAASASLVWIHASKELENFLLVPTALEKALKERIAERVRRGVSAVPYAGDLITILDEVCEEAKANVYSQCIAKYQEDARSLDRGVDSATVARQALDALNGAWAERETRLKIVPGKDVLSRLNEKLQDAYKVALSPAIIISSMTGEEVLPEMRQLIASLDEFGHCQVP